MCYAIYSPHFVLVKKQCFVQLSENIFEKIFWLFLRATFL